MNRDQLIAQVKDEYARLADISTKESFSNTNASKQSDEAYYESLLQDVIHGIESGAFDEFQTGKEIVEAVANNRDKWL
jgi:hypothetical protein